MSEITPVPLSAQALAELKEIAHDEFGADTPDDEIREIGLRLLRVLALIEKGADQIPASPRKPTEEQFQALKYIHNSIYHDRTQPTIRGLTEALGLRSSRSGFRMLNDLIDQGFVHRNEDGAIVMRADVAGCETSFSF